MPPPCLDQLTSSTTAIGFNWPSIEGATHYDITFGWPHSPFWETLQCLQTQQHIIKKLNPGARFAARVRAVNAVKGTRGPWSLRSPDLYVMPIDDAAWTERKQESGLRNRAL
eukprot:2957533-Prymnesium_polylepis.1